MIMVMIAKSCPILDFQDFEGQKFHFQFSNKSYWANIEKAAQKLYDMFKNFKAYFFLYVWLFVFHLVHKVNIRISCHISPLRSE